MTVHVAHERTLSGPPPGARRWVYLGEDPAWRLAAQNGALRGLELLPTHTGLQRHAAALRGPYLDWIADLGVHNDMPEWWASELAAKNVYTFLFQRLCAAAVAAEILDDDLLVVCATPALSATVARIARESGLKPDLQVSGRGPAFRARETAHRIYHGLPRNRTALPAPVAGDDLLVTWVDERSFDANGGYRDPHFGPLAAMLRDRGDDVSLLARILPSANRRRTAHRLAASGERVYLVDALLTTADWRDAWRRARAFTPAIPDDARVGDVPAAALARELLATHRMSHAGALTYDAIIRRLSDLGAQPARIIVPWEGHAWETALFGAVRSHLPGAELIAYDNLNFSSLALSLYPGAAELGVRPLPDRVVTNGPTFAGILADAGFPRERIRVGCALRHAHLYEPRPTAQALEPFVLAAGSIDASQTIEMITAAEAAFGADLLVKLHPASDTARIQGAVPSAVRFDARPLPELLPTARAMIYTYSIVPYEALAAGVPPIFFQSQTLLDLDQLEPTPDVRWSGATPQELRLALDSAEVTAADPAWKDRAQAVVRAALACPTPSCLDAFVRPA